MRSGYFAISLAVLVAQAAAFINGATYRSTRVGKICFLFAQQTSHMLQKIWRYFDSNWLL